LLEMLTLIDQSVKKADYIENKIEWSS
jgi:hypothetical protein